MQAAPVASRCLPLPPCGLGTPLQESLPSYINRLAGVHALPVSTFFSRELVPLIASPADRSLVSNYFGNSSRYLLLGDGLASKVAAHLARLNAVPQVTALVHPYLAGSLGWTRDLRGQVAWCPECFVEWHQAGKPLYFPLLWAFRATRCCLHHNVLLRDACPDCSRHFSYLVGRTWKGDCFQCGRSFGDGSPVSTPTHIDVESTRLVEGLVTWAAELTAPADFHSVLLSNVAAAAAAVGGAKPLSKAIVRSPTVVGFWLRRRQSPTLTSLLRLGLVFGIPLEDWLSGAMGPERFQKVCPIPVTVPWLSEHATSVPAAHVQDVLRLAVAQPADPPLSLYALARTIPANSSRLYRDFRELTSQIVTRHRVYCAQRKKDYAAELAALVRGAIAELRVRGLPPTAYGVFRYLGSRWPLSRRRLRDVFCKIRSA
jgi:hypothetical protein